MKRIVGVDLDNTIVSYDHLFYQIALKNNLIRHDFNGGKKAIRDTVRQLPDGEIEWQKLQAEAYGPSMLSAQVIEGVKDFFALCLLHSVPVYIISHKTQYASYDSTQTDLRVKVMEWLSAQGFFDPDGLALPREHVFFGSTRQEKIDRIVQLQCTHFVDDLLETFMEETFPKSIQQFLFDPHQEYDNCAGLTRCTSWNEITKAIFTETI